jgi:hypothetical protein
MIWIGLRVMAMDRANLVLVLGLGLGLRLGLGLALWFGWVGVLFFVRNCC